MTPTNMAWVQSESNLPSTNALKYAIAAFIAASAFVVVSLVAYVIGEILHFRRKDNENTNCSPLTRLSACAPAIDWMLA
jgi:hypothetical protein